MEAASPHTCGTGLLIRPRGSDDMNVRRLRLLLCVVGLVGAGFFLVIHPSRPLTMWHKAVDIVSADGTVLRGTLSLPRWVRRPVPAVVIVHGSGPRTRDDLRGDVRRLVREGFGVLAYDKRGVGASQGVYPRSDAMDSEAILRLLAQDAAAAFDHVRREKSIDPSRLGFFGASQAGWIIPLAAQQLSPQPRFHIVLSGAAVSTGVEELYSQLTGDGLRDPQLTDPAEIKERVDGFTGPNGFDPAPLLQALQVPTLWLLGERDESVPTFATVRAIDSIRAFVTTPTP